MKRIIIVLFLILFCATLGSGQEESGTFKRDPGIYFGIGPGLYVSSFLDRNKTTDEPYESVTVLSEGQTAVTWSGIIFFEFDISSHFSIQSEIGFYPCSHKMDYIYWRGPNYTHHDTGDYKLSYFNTQLSLLFSFNQGSRLRYFFGPFLNIPFGETCTGQVKITYDHPNRKVIEYNEMIYCDLKPCLGFAAGIGFNFNAWRMPLLIELKSGITLTETGIPPVTCQPPRQELFISINLAYLLRLKKKSFDH